MKVFKLLIRIIYLDFENFEWQKQQQKNVKISIYSSINLKNKNNFLKIIYEFNDLFSTNSALIAIFVYFHSKCTKWKIVC